MSHSFTLHDLPLNERPRERLYRFGAETLSILELLTIVLGRGIRGESVMITAQNLLSRFRSVKAIAQASVEELSSVRGIGPAKATLLKAVFELGRRNTEYVESRMPIRRPSDVAKLLGPRLRDKSKEHFLILCLDSRNAVKRISEIAVGTLNSSLVHPREVFKEAIQALAASIVLVHNHPSGHTEPSQDDIALTRAMAATGSTIGIAVLDHVIIGADNQAYSFKEHGLIQEL